LNQRQHLPDFARPPLDDQNRLLSDGAAMMNQSEAFNMTMVSESIGVMENNAVGQSIMSMGGPAFLDNSMQ